MTLTRKTPAKPRKPMKRGKPLSRRFSLRSSVTTEMRKPRTPIPKINVEQTLKRKKRQRAKHRAYMASETRKLVEARSEGRCEAIQNAVITYMPLWWWDLGVSEVEPLWRCENPATDHHHRTYARYGGDELPEDVIHLCKRCHAYFESLKPTRAAHRFAAGASQREERA